MTKTIAIFGLSGVGKTTIAAELGKILEFPVRNCGQIVRDTARSLGCNPDEIPDDQHLRVDEETRQAVLKFGPRLIVEGRFLDRVLAEHGGILFIELTCNVLERINRARTAGKSSAFIESQDRYSEDFCGRVYLGIAPAKAAFTIPTDCSSPDTLAGAILERICLV